MRFGSSGLRAGLTITTLSALAGLFVACADECTTNGDCKGTEVCSAGECVPGGPAPIRRPGEDASTPDVRIEPDAAAPDAAAPDAQADGGVVGDGGGPTGDGGAPGDGGLTDGGGSGGGVESVGLIEVSEVRTSTDPELRVHGRFVSFARAAVRTAYAGRDGPCELVDRVATGNAGNGIGGTNIRVVGFTAAPTDAVTLIDVQAGVFEPKSSLQIRSMFPGGQPALAHTIASGVGNGELGMASATLSSEVPSMIVTQPANMGSVFMVGVGPMDFVWQPMAGVMGLTVAVEISNGRGDAVLRCTAADRGMMSVPLAARQAFVGLAPAGPYRVQIQFERSVSLNVPRIGGGTVFTTVRHLRGVRYRGM